MRYKTEEAFGEYLKDRVKNERLISVAKGNLQEILDFCFPEYDGLKLYIKVNDKMVDEIIKNNNKVKGLFGNNKWIGTFTVTDDDGYELMPLEGICPSIICRKTSTGFSDKQRDYQIIYHYGDDMIVLNSHYIASGKDYKNRIISVAI